jgi:4-hydroxy-3-methylbut-2-enyl diphosphate reductase
LKKVSIHIDDKSGFCFGVQQAIQKAEEHLKTSPSLTCLGQIVHNEEEVQRLEKLGMKTISSNNLKDFGTNTILFRAHGEPPERYSTIKEQQLPLIDGTCPVVLKLQQRIRKAWEASKDNNTQVVIYGKKGHAEVIGLMGQTGHKATLIDNIDNIENIDFDKNIELFSQTTRSLEEYHKLSDSLKQRAKRKVIVHDTICRQVSNRAEHLAKFSKQFDLILFVGGKQSSNGKYLHQICKQNNQQSYLISSTEEIEEQWLQKDITSIGICGATSTPQWLMENVKLKTQELLNSKTHG